MGLWFDDELCLLLNAFINHAGLTASTDVCVFFVHKTPAYINAVRACLRDTMCSRGRKLDAESVDTVAVGTGPDYLSSYRWFTFNSVFSSRKNVYISSITWSRCAYRPFIIAFPVTILWSGCLRLLLSILLPFLTIKKIIISSSSNRPVILGPHTLTSGVDSFHSWRRSAYFCSAWRLPRPVSIDGDSDGFLGASNGEIRLR
jgi:hypothetical protein